MHDWLIANCSILGLPGQNWMLVAAGMVAIYGVALVLFERRKTFRRPSRKTLR